jgi:hypothetical protein
MNSLCFLLIFGLYDNTHLYLPKPNSDSVYVFHTIQRYGRYKFRCYYYKDSLKIDSISTNSEVSISFERLKSIKSAFVTEKKYHPQLLNISPVEGLVNPKTGIGLYYVSEGKLLSNITYYKLLISQDSVYLNTGTQDTAFYINQVRLFKQKVKSFSKNKMKKIKDDYIKVWH